MLGQKVVSVVRIPHIALLSTGDELIEIGSPLEPGKIYDANSYLLSTQINESGGDCLYLGVARDNYESIYQCLERAYSRRVDLIVSSAGVSVGAFDLVRKVLEENGQISFWRIKMRPGKPLAFGKYHDIPFIGLPGNPVSAFVGFEIFIRPAIQKMRGMNPYLRPVSKVKILEPIVSDGRESYLRGLVIQRENGLFAKLVGHQGSGNIRSLIQSNAFLIVPSEVKSLPIGAEVNAWITGAIQEG
jgi:molybdopterin molybdotransferase